MKAIAIIGMLLMNYTLTRKFLMGVEEDQEDSVGTDYNSRQFHKEAIKVIKIKNEWKFPFQGPMGGFKTCVICHSSYFH